LSDDRVTPNWVIQAVQLAAGGALPLIGSIDSAAQLAQSCLALSRHGIVFLIGFEPDWISSQQEAAVSIVEWLARHSGAAVIPLIPVEWTESNPVDRLLFRAWTLADSDVPQEVAMRQPEDPVDDQTGQIIRTTGMSQVMGSPHPLSEVEKRVWGYLSNDPDLAQLFRCNQTVMTALGTRHRVDLLWPEGRIVVELDGYADHGLREAFERDRHRDYELLLSGHQVLRITNDEIHRDFEAAMGKIRDIVNLKQKAGGQLE
jgi:very-short-patch-repair endonuclease